MSKELEEVQGRLAVARAQRESLNTEAAGLNERLAGGKLSTYTLIDLGNRKNEIANELEKLAVEIADLELREKSLADATDRYEAARQEAQLRLLAEERGFWFRRFMLSLQVGNGAGLLAALSGVMQADDRAVAAKVAALPAALFAVGLLAAGVLPGILWVQRLSQLQRPRLQEAVQALAMFFTIGAAVMFTGAVGRLVTELAMLAQPTPPAAAAAASHAAASHPPNAASTSTRSSAAPSIAPAKAQSAVS